MFLVQVFRVVCGERCKVELDLHNVSQLLE